MNAAGPRYELFDHTADLGVHVWAPSISELVRPATDGFYATIGDVVAAGDLQMREFDLAGDDSALLLRDYLAELLHLFEHEQRRFVLATVREFSAVRLAVVGSAAAVDASRSVLEREVKAVTYHELAIRAIASGYEATFIVDI